VASIADDLVIIAAGRVVAAGPTEVVSAGHPTLEDAFFSLTGKEATP
jgi:ABC-2 type transport system ATP-binding protein